MPMVPTITKVTPIFPARNFVQWTVEDPDNVILQFEVLRSGSPGGPFEIISDILLDSVYFYTDTSPHNYGLTTRIWYRVKAIPTSGVPNAVLSDPVSAGALARDTRAKIARKARYDLGVGLQRLNGVEMYVLKRKRFGQRCSTCYNEETKDVVISHCAECYGTSFDGGYHTPLQVWGKFDPAVVHAAFDRSGDTEMAVHGITMQDYPEVEADDVLVERRTNRRFIVQKKVPTEASRIPVHQDLQVSELSRSAVEYAVTVTI